MKKLENIIYCLVKIYLSGALFLMSGSSMAFREGGFKTKTKKNLLFSHFFKGIVEWGKGIFNYSLGTRQWVMGMRALLMYSDPTKKIEKYPSVKGLLIENCVFFFSKLGQEFSVLFFCNEVAWRRIRRHDANKSWF